VNVVDVQDGEESANSRGFNHSDTYTSATSTGTSIRGPITPAKACWEVTPQMLMHTAIASSKLLPAAVKARAQVRGIEAALGADSKRDAPHQQEVEPQRDRHLDHLGRSEVMLSASAAAFAWPLRRVSNQTTHPLQSIPLYPNSYAIASIYPNNRHAPYPHEP
jgi:hypothetical protein